MLPNLKEEKREFIKSIVDWIFANSFSLELFKLILNDTEISSDSLENAVFYHPDDTCC